jgi:ABC-type branched-subunit amino acid transport system permease subunit
VLSEMLELSGPGRVVFGGEAGVPAPGFPFDETGTARFAGVLLAIVLTGLWGLARSNFGVAVRTVRADERTAAASGINVVRVRVAAFVISGALAGLSGGCAAGLAGRASPSMLSLSMTLFPVAAASLGGVGTLFGPVAAYVLAVGLHWADVSGPARLAFFALLITGAGLAVPRWGARLIGSGWRTHA